jgi:hypothetical protein
VRAAFRSLTRLDEAPELAGKLENVETDEIFGDTRNRMFRVHPVPCRWGPSQAGQVQVP